MLSKDNGIPETIAEVEDDTWRVEALYLGEGICGDYDPNDPEDEPLMRFDVMRKAAIPQEEEQEYSYCTATPASNTEACKKFISLVLHTLQAGGDKRDMERLTWLNAAIDPQPYDALGGEEHGVKL